MDPRQPTPSEPTFDPADIAPLLDEHHLVVLGDHPAERDACAEGLRRHLEQRTPDTRVASMEGHRIRDLETFCARLEESLGRPAGTLERSVDRIVECLRTRPGDARHDYLLWRDADTLLEHDVELFGRLVNALIGVAAEREYVSADLLVIQRVVFLGDDKLGAYAEDENGQFRSWLVRDGVTRFWEVASCLERPPVLTYRLDG